MGIMTIITDHVVTALVIAIHGIVATRHKLNMNLSGLLARFFYRLISAFAGRLTPSSCAALSGTGKMYRL